MTQARALVTSPDGQWVAVRRGREVLLLAAGAPPAVGQITLDSDDVDLALVGPPGGLVVITRHAAITAITLHQPPLLEVVARLESETIVRLVAVSGPRLVMLSADNKHVTILRAVGRALSTQTIDVGGPVEFAVGLDRNQVLFGLQRKLETWDLVSGRPMLRLQLQLPPAPRTIGTAAGHLWVTRPGSDEVFIYRLSDGRPFQHVVGSPVDDAISHPASPLLVLATRRGLVRVNCFAHSTGVIENAPWSPSDEPIPLAQLAAGEDVTLLGLPADASEPWRVPLAGIGLTNEALPARPAAAKPPAPPPEARPRVHAGWREALATFGAELARGAEVQVPAVPGDTELGELAQRLALTPVARRALVVLYALHLVGDPAPSIAKLARVLADWTEALGRGELTELAMVRRKHGTVALRAAVTDLLDGSPPRRIRLVGGAPTTPRTGAHRVSREGRADAEIETELASKLGRIAIVEGKLPAALLEARMHGATAVTMSVPDERPKPWPRDAGLVLVLYSNATAWVADVPTLDPVATE
ncbi:MAG: hypothetical protein JWO36_5915 [Myxococcales bacterium]|nr:hypothetical protein [Myxococcales bacterium]